MAITAANGPQGLVNVLNKLIEQKNTGLLPRGVEQYIQYSNGGSEAFIKVDLNAKPYHFWCYDNKHGRSMPESIIDILKNFARAKDQKAALCVVRDVRNEELHTEKTSFLNGGSWGSVSFLPLSEEKVIQLLSMQKAAKSTLFNFFRSQTSSSAKPNENIVVEHKQKPTNR